MLMTGLNSYLTGVSSPTIGGTVTLAGGGIVPSGQAIDLYNTADQTTNYERLRLFWTGNVASIRMQKGGTGSDRSISILEPNGYGWTISNASVATSATINSGSVDTSLRFGGYYQTSTSAVGAFDLYNSQAGSEFGASSGVQKVLRLGTDVRQTGTAGYTMLDIVAGEITTGSGAKRLIIARVNATEKFTVNSEGTISAAGGLALQAPPAIKAANYTLTTHDYLVRFDTTAATRTADLPDAATCSGQLFVIANAAGANSVTIDGNGGQTIDGAATLTVAAGGKRSIQSDGANWFTTDNALSSATSTAQVGVLVSPHHSTSNVTGTRTLSTGTSLAYYVGRAPKALTSVTVAYKVTSGATGITWAELGIAKGSINPGGNPTLTPVGYADASVPFAAATAQQTTVNVDAGQSVAQGDDLWVIYAKSSTGSPIFRANTNGQDEIGVGFYATANVRPSTTLGTGAAWTIDTTNIPIAMAVLIA